MTGWAVCVLFAAENRFLTHDFTTYPLHHPLSTLTANSGELCIDNTIAYLAEKFGGVTPGACADEGYTVFDHTESVSMGPLGEAEVKIYTKP